MDILATDELLKIEQTIISLKQQTVSNIIEIGNNLNEAKRMLSHGEWGRWLEEKVGFSARTANNYMRIAKEFDSNSQAIADLDNTKLQILLDIPKEERDDFIKNHNVKDMSTRDLRKETKKHNACGSEPVDETACVEEEVNNADTIDRIREPLKRIDAIDNLAEENRRKIETLQKENDRLMTERRKTFRSFDQKCPVKYRWNDMKTRVQIYIDFDGRENVLYDGWLLGQEPDGYKLCNVPEKYQNDFRMIWDQAYREYEESERRKKEEEKRKKEEGKRLFEQLNNNLNQPQMSLVPEELKPYIKKIFNAALKVYHVDNNIKPQEVVDNFNEEEIRAYNDRLEECNGMTMIINQLKEMYGV